MNKSSVIMKSEISLRRNLSDYNFMLVIDMDSCDTMKSQVEEQLDNLGYIKDSYKYDFKNMKSTDKDYLKKQGYISSIYYEDVMPVVIMNQDKKTVFTLLDDDHINIIKYGLGKDLKEVYEEACDIEELLDEKLDFAFDIDIGYLTDDIFEAGSLMKACVIMDLRALEYSKKIEDIKKIAKYRGYEFKKAYNSKDKSCIYQLSTTGNVIDPEYTISDMQLLINSICKKEMDERGILLNGNPEFKDEILRSVGMLRYSRVLDELEGLNKIGNLLIAIDLNIVEGYEFEKIMELVDTTSKLNLEEFKKENNSNQNIGVLRSEVIKDVLERQVRN